jgi:hypothetical protein
LRALHEGKKEKTEGNENFTRHFSSNFWCFQSQCENPRRRDYVQLQQKVSSFYENSIPSEKTERIEIDGELKKELEIYLCNSTQAFSRYSLLVEIFTDLPPLSF